ncbi:DMSO/selenate family reductase complex A subunit [Oleidesulfovibrio sp.]|uniref:DMSO/selenate family reductase complex A subunit n=1 Tax=Oleidesulfovibrio sp. TaxID=2909707 RepID=UPI003A867C24
MNSNEDRGILSPMGRREFLKWTAIAGGTLAAHASGLLAFVGQAQAQKALGFDRSVWTCCTVNCGSRCLIKGHVKDGALVRISTDDTGDDTYGTHQIRACLRGRSIRKRVNHPDRLKYPLKRVGERGEGKFERITWEQAFEEIAGRMQKAIKEHGNESLFINYGTGTLGAVMSRSWHPSASPMARLMNAMGGYVDQYGDYSAGQLESALPPMFGSGWVAGNTFADIRHSKLVLLFGDNPAGCRMSGGGLVYDIIKARQDGMARIISIDPRYTDTNTAVGDEWIPIRPGTDTALVCGLAHVLIRENLVDQEFLDNCTIGFDEDHMPEGVGPNNSYKSYILGLGEDGVEKTPEWASEITGIPAQRIIQLAREVAGAKPAFIVQGWSLQRHANGEQTARAICTLAALTGNIGVRGGNTGAREGNVGFSFVPFPMLKNNVKAVISHYAWPMAIERGKTMTATNAGVRGAEKLGADMKFLWSYAGNALINQHSDINATAKLLKDDTKLETIVVVDNFMTSSARFADYVLPAVTTQEERDLCDGAKSSVMQYLIFADKVVEPMGECKSIYDICVGIAGAVSPELKQKYTEGRTRDQWIEYLYHETRKKYSDLPADMEEAFNMGVYKKRIDGEPPVPYEAFRKDSDAHPLNTPSGKVEIFCKELHDIGLRWELPKGDRITGLPIYDPAWEGPSDPLTEKYPLQLIGHHYKQRTHSSYGNLEWTAQVAPQRVWMNPLDAQARGISHGDMVEIFNDRGRVRIPAKVTDRIAPGVASLPQGAWYTPDKDGVDTGGCINTLTLYRPTPLAKSNPQHTNLVEIKKA